MNRKIGVILSYVLMLFEVLSTLLITPLIVHTLGQAEYGVYKLSASVVGYLLLLDLGVGNAVVRYISKYRVLKDQISERKFLGLSTLFYLGIAIVALAIGVVFVYLFPTFFSEGLNESEIALGQNLLLITTFTTVITLGTSGYVNTIIGYEQFAVSRIFSIVVVILKIIGFFIVLKLGYGSIGLVTVNFFITLISRIGLTLYVLIILKLRPLFMGIDKNFVREILTYSLLVFIQMVATMLDQTVDLLLIGSLVKGATLFIAIYSIGSQLVQYFQTMGISITGVLMPGIVRMVEQGGTNQDIEKEMTKIGRLIFMLLGMIWGVFLVSGKDFVILWVGEENMKAYYIAVLLMFVNIFSLTFSVGSQVLWAQNKHKEQALLKILIVFMNIFLTFWLIKIHPLYGAVAGTFISLLLGNVFLQLLIFKIKIKVNVSRYLKRLAKGIVGSLSIMILFGYLISIVLSHTILGFSIKVLLMVIVYIACLYTFGFNKYELNLFQSLLARNKRTSK